MYTKYNILIRMEGLYDNLMNILLLLLHLYSMI